MKLLPRGVIPCMLFSISLLPMQEEPPKLSDLAIEWLVRHGKHITPFDLRNLPPQVRSDIRCEAKLECVAAHIERDGLWTFASHDEQQLCDERIANSEAILRSLKLAKSQKGKVPRCPLCVVM